MENKLQEVLFVLLDEFADWEFASLASALNQKPDHTNQKYKVKTVSLTRDPIHSIGGLTVIPDYSLNSVPTDFAGLILIGGNSWRKETSFPVLKLVHQTLEKQLILGGICDASVFLAVNGILNSTPHTSNDLEDVKENGGVNYTGELLYQNTQVVRAGKIITANGSAFLEFGKEVLLALKACPDEEIEEWYHYFKLGHYEFMAQQFPKSN